MARKKFTTGLLKTLAVVLAAMVIGGVAACALQAAPRNVIIIIGDGMSFEQVRAAGMYLFGAEGTLSFEALPHQGQITTYSANSSVTDSAAAATAVATGQKVNNGVISQAIPGDGGDLYTLLEYFRDRGRSTGLVTTTYMTHATPASFGAHETSRNNLSQIAGDYLNQTRPNVLFGGGSNGLSVIAAEAAGYTVVTTRAEMAAVDPTAVTYLSGQFGTTHLPYEYDYATGFSSGYDTLPHLSEMVGAALGVLNEDPDGLFLMIEAGRIDHAGHANRIDQNIFETIELHETVQQVIQWATGHPDTLVLLTADHETGGLTITANNGQGVLPSVTWSTTGHTGVNVPVYAWGPNAVLVGAVVDNTDLFHVATVDTLAVSVALGADWVYQNTPATLANNGHIVALEITVTDLADNTSYGVSVAKIPGSGSGEVTIVNDPGGNPLIKYIYGNMRTDGTTGTGPLTLEVTVTGDVAGEQSVEAPLTVRMLGDVDGNGGLEPGDVSVLISKLNGTPPPGYDPQAFDLDANGGAEPGDVQILINILNGLPVP